MLKVRSNKNNFPSLERLWMRRTCRPFIIALRYPWVRQKNKASRKNSITATLDNTSSRIAAWNSVKRLSFGHINHKNLNSPLKWPWAVVLDIFKSFLNTSAISRWSRKDRVKMWQVRDLRGKKISNSNQGLFNSLHTLQTLTGINLFKTIFSRRPKKTPP